MTLAEALARFDRKERNWLIRDALGKGARQLSADFAKRLEAQVQKRDSMFRMEPDAWWAIDYHIDWVVAALYILQHGVPDRQNTRPNNPVLIKGHHQDIDLVIASGTTLILVEARGDGSWSGKGLPRKVSRLEALTPNIIGSDERAGLTRVHFVLCCPKPPQSIVLSQLPKLGKGTRRAAPLGAA